MIFDYKKPVAKGVVAHQEEVVLTKFSYSNLSMIFKFKKPSNHRESSSPFCFDEIGAFGIKRGHRAQGGGHFQSGQALRVQNRVGSGRVGLKMIKFQRKILLNKPKWTQLLLDLVGVLRAFRVQNLVNLGRFGHRNQKIWVWALPATKLGNYWVMTSVRVQ